jgi:hypothetical protein
MNTKQVTRTDFEGFFEKAMKITTIIIADEYGEMEDTVIPRIIIRDFSINAKTDYGYDLDKCDSDFIDLEQAWSYFQEVGAYSRIMAADGTIFADYFDNKVKESVVMDENSLDEGFSGDGLEGC